jgi:hypothetical protein
MTPTPLIASTTSNNRQQHMCEDCQRLVGAEQRAAPHRSLLRTGSMVVSYVIGTVEEVYYRCRNCDREWLHETGPVGLGWMS